MCRHGGAEHCVELAATIKRFSPVSCPPPNLCQQLGDCHLDLVDALQPHQHNALMADQVPFIKGVRLDEPFFDSVIKRAGGKRLLEEFTPPMDTKHVDYLIGGFALELKVLTADPLDAPERQARLQEFFRREFPRGPIWITPTRQSVTLVGQMAKEYWERFLGKPAQDRLDSAADQIADTLTFVPGPLRGGVIIVNAGGASLDWLSFTHLVNHYQERFEPINAVFAVNGVPAMVAGEHQIHFVTIAKEGHRAEADTLGLILDGAI